MGTEWLFKPVVVGMAVLVILGPSETLCGENIRRGAQELLLYSLDDNEKFLLEGRLVIDESLPIQNKLRLLLDEVSRRHFSDLPPIEILETLKTKDGFVVVLNLTEDEQDFFQSKWYRRFQGSTGDSQTRFRLIYTSLQPDYPGFWFAGVKVFWNGKPIDSEDADLFISRITYRSKMRKNCSIGQECR